ncbi:MAG: hypothetical protein HFJ53_08625 [Clostridia bacterium]|nr:hypothetical protein [Clostridia bacterium]
MLDFLLGKEIYLFFGIYGINGIIGIFLSSIFIGCIIYKVFIIVKQNNIEKYYNFIDKIYKNKKINEIIKAIVNIFLLISFYVMVAGFCAYFVQELQIPNIVGALIFIPLCLYAFIKNIEGIMKINFFLIPILIIFIILLAIKNIYNIQNINQIQIDSNFQKSIYYAILYTSYNTITLIPILVSLENYIKNKKQILKISITCSIILFLLAISVYIILLSIKTNIAILELPIVYVAGKLRKNI